MKASPARRALVVGATGLVGTALVRALLADPGIAELIVLGRRPLPAEFNSPRLRHVIVEDFLSLEKLEGTNEGVEAIDEFYSALGTTARAAGSPEAFRRVDFEAVLAAARFAESRGARRAFVVSAVGADPHASAFYLRVKGELEHALAALSFTQVVAARPSLILGDRQERRPTEAIARRVAPWIAPLCRGPLRRYTPIADRDIARALARLAREVPVGPRLRVVEYDELISLARRPEEFPT
jgi:uncharacterized protein YbjT (DUF2867 family)